MGAYWPYYRVLEAHCRHFSHFAADAAVAVLVVVVVAQSTTRGKCHIIYIIKKSTSFPSYMYFFYYFSVSASVKLDTLNLRGK